MFTTQQPAPRMMQRFVFYQLLMLALCIMAGTSRAQEPVYRTLNQLAGLPSNTVYHMLEDEYGFIWLAHTRGVSRYDGKNFKHFVTPGDQGKAVSNLLRYNGSTWCQDFSGRFFYTRGDSLVEETRVRFSGNYTEAGILANGTLVYYYLNRLILLNLKTGQENQFFISGVTATHISTDKKTFLSASTQGTYITNGNTPTLLPLSNEIAPGVIITAQFNNRILFIRKDESSVVHVLEKDSLYQIPLLPPGISVHQIEPIENELWISTSNGAYRYDKDLKPLNQGRPFFSSYNVNHVIRDREGNFWFSTLNRGLYIVPNLEFRLYTYQGASISSILFDTTSQKLYVGSTTNELLEFDANRNFIPRFSSPVNHEVTSLFSSKKDGFFIMSDKFRVVDRSFQQKLEMSLAVKQVATINDDLYAIAYTGGIDVFDFSTSGTSIPKWLQFYQKNIGIHRRVGLFARTVRGRSTSFNRADSTLYASSATGLYYFSNRASGEIKLNQQPIVANDLILADQFLIASTFSQGLLRITDTTASPLLNKSNGLRSNTVYKARIQDGICWFLQDGTIGRYDLHTRKLTLIDNSYGLPKSDLLDLVVTPSLIYVATTEGLVVFDPNDIRREFIVPKLFINEFLVNGENVNYSSGIRLGQSSNNIEIQFSLLNFKQQDILQLKYRINKGNWSILPPSVRTLQLPALEGGNYLIELAICDLDGITLAQPDPIRFSIKTAWFKNLWFWLIAIGIVALLTNLYLQQRIRLINQSNKLEQEKLLLEREVQKSRLSSIKSQMNPHFIFNALNTIQAYIYTNNQEKAAGYLQKFSELTRRILNMSNTDTIPLREEFRALQLYLDLEQQRLEEPADVIWDIDPRLDIDLIHIPSMLIQPYLENAIKHGLLHKKGKKELTLRFTSRGENLEIQVEDNGIGRKRAAEMKSNRMEQHQSFAVGANKKRLDILNHGRKTPIIMAIVDKYGENQEPLGTRVTLSIPRFSSNPS